jgi:hypothetical protein
MMLKRFPQYYGTYSILVIWLRLAQEVDDQ